MTSLVETQGPKAGPQRWMSALGAAVSILLAVATVGLVVIEEEAPAGYDMDVAVVLAAAERTSNSASATFTSEMRMEATGNGLTLFTVSGHVDFASGRGTATASALGFEVEMRVTEQTAYVMTPRPGPRVRLKPGTWYAVGADQIPKDDSPLAMLGGATVGDPDPASVFNLLRERGVVKRVRRRGSEVVGGEPTTVYRLTLDTGVLKDADDQIPVPGEVNVDEVVVDVYVTRDGLVRRHALRMALSLRGERTDATYTTDFSNFGASVQVQEPPADQVVRLGSIEELQNMIGTGG